MSMPHSRMSLASSRTMSPSPPPKSWAEGVSMRNLEPVTVSAPPGYKLYYLWAMAGAERKLALHEDPAHKWIHEQQ